MRIRSDHDLVDAARDGDPDAFAALYDRYADRVHTFAYARLRDPADSADAVQTTFITAHRRLDQLADPSRFRPWVFAIARTTIIDVGRERSRRTVEASADTESMPDLVGDDRAPGRDLEAEESAALLWEAATGLQPRDQELLELHLREGLDGADLAEAMNVEPGHVYVMVKRLKERLGTAVGSLLVARRGRGDCAELDRVLGEWDGRFSLDVRSRVTRHVEGCDTCRNTRKAAIGWEQIAAAMPRIPAPVSSRLAVLGATGGTIGAIGGAASGAAASADPTGSTFTTVASVVGSIAATIGMLAWPVVGSGGPDVEVAGIVETIDTTTSTTLSPTSTTMAAPTTTTPPNTTSTAPITAPTTTASTTTTTTPPRPTPTAVLGPAPTTTPPAPSTAAPSSSTTTTTTTTSTTTTSTTTTTTSTTTTTTTTIPAPVGPVLASSVTEVAFGALLDTVTVPLSNTGDQVLSWTATIPAGTNFTVLGANKGTILPGASGTVTIVFDRSVPRPEGDYPAVPTDLAITTGVGGSLSLPLTASVERAPGIDFSVLTNPIVEDGGPCAGGAAGLPVVTTVIATIAEESGVTEVLIEWDGTIEPMTLDPTDPSGTDYLVEIGSLAAGTYDITVSATDERGNTASSIREDELIVDPCPT